MVVFGSWGGIHLTNWRWLHLNKASFIAVAKKETLVSRAQFIIKYTGEINKLKQVK